MNWPEKLIDEATRIRQNPWGRLASHLLFWVIIGGWVWSDYSRSWLISKENGFEFYLIELVFLIISFYLLDYGLKKSLLKSFLSFPITLLLVFLVSEYFTYIYFIRLGPSFYASQYMMVMNEKIKNSGITWWNLPIKSSIIYTTMTVHFFYLIVPLSVKGFYELFKYVRKNERLEKDNLTLELNFLRAQVNPHFLFNTLNNIYAFVEDSNKEAAEAILKLSKLMRYSLYESNEQKIELSREIDILEAYIDLEQIRLGRRATVTFVKEGDFQGQTIPPLILLTFVENAFKHGIHAGKGQAWVNIHIHAIAEKLHFYCKNSRPPKAIITDLNKEGGIGLKNAQRRLELYYDKSYELEIQREEKLYAVQLKIELN